MCRKQRILSASDRHQPLPGVPCHQAPRSIAFPAIRSSPPDAIDACRPTFKTPRISLTFWGNSDQPQYVQITCPLFRKMMFRVMHLPKTIQPWVSTSAQTKAFPQSNACHVPKNGQARRRPLESPGSNTRTAWLGNKDTRVLIHPRQREGLTVFERCYKERIINSAA